MIVDRIMGSILNRISFVYFYETKYVTNPTSNNNLYILQRNLSPRRRRRPEIKNCTTYFIDGH